MSYPFSAVGTILLWGFSVSASIAVRVSSPWARWLALQSATTLFRLWIATNRRPSPLRHLSSVKVEVSHES